MPDRVPEDMPDRMLEDMPDRMPVGMRPRDRPDDEESVANRMTHDPAAVSFLVSYSCLVCRLSPSLPSPYVEIECQIKWQIECQKICQIKCQNVCQIECQKI